MDTRGLGRYRGLKSGCRARTEEGPVNRIRSLQLLNISDTGLAAVCQDPLDLHSNIAVFFPPEGISRGWDAYGHVLRVNAAQRGYDVAVAFDRLPAA